MRDVAEAVGINQATLLYHFRDKEELIVWVVDDLIGRFRAANEGRYAVEPGSFAGFEGHLQTLGSLFVSSPEIYVALNEIAVRAIRHEKIAAKIAAVEENWTNYIGRLLRAAAPHADAQTVTATARATVIYVRGVSAKAVGDGTLTALMARKKDRKPAAARIQAALDVFAALVRGSLSAAHPDEILTPKRS